MVQKSHKQPGNVSQTLNKKREKTHGISTTNQPPVVSEATRFLVAINSSITPAGSHRIISKDGFPRTLEQAKALDSLLAKNGEAVSLIIEFAVDMAILEASGMGADRRDDDDDDDDDDG